MVRKALVQDIPHIKKITEACAQHMIDQGIYQWNKNYPSLEVLTKDVKANNVYVYLLEQEIIATVMFSMEMDDFYREIDWLIQDAKQLYVHRLAVHPTYQGQGIARGLMDFGEALAKEKECLSIRLDTFSQTLEIIVFIKRDNTSKWGKFSLLKKVSTLFTAMKRS